MKRQVKIQEAENYNLSIFYFFYIKLTVNSLNQINKILIKFNKIRIELN